MTTKNVTCPVDLQGDYVGEYTNAFRIMQDGTDVVMDFCVYSEHDHAAKVVSRLRMSPTFLSSILERVKNAVGRPLGDSLLYVMPEVEGNH